MNDASKNHLQKIKALPEEIKNALFSEETANRVDQIVKKHRLENRHADISDTIASVLLGELEPKELSKNLQQKNIGTDTALRVVQEINDQIFAKIRVHLQKLYPPGAFKPSAEEHLRTEKPEPPKEPPKIPAKLEAPKPPEISKPVPPRPEAPKPPEIPRPEAPKPPTPPPITPPPLQKQEEISPPKGIRPIPRYTPPEKDKYLEPVEDEKEPGPKLEGNVVDLSEE